MISLILIFFTKIIYYYFYYNFYNIFSVQNLCIFIIYMAYFSKETAIVLDTYMLFKKKEKKFICV